MPVNAPAEYYKAEMKYAQAKSREEKMALVAQALGGDAGGIGSRAQCPE